MRIIVQALPTAPGGGLTLVRDLLGAWDPQDDLLVLAWRSATVDALTQTGHPVLAVKARSTPEAVVRLRRPPNVVRRFEPEAVWSQAVRIPWEGFPQAVHWRDIGSFERVHRPSIRRRVRRLREAADLKDADLRVFNSHAILAAATARHPVIADLANVVIPNGLELAPFLAAGEFDAPGDRVLRILVPQSDSPHKQNELAAEVAVRVAGTLPKGFTSMKLIIPGAGEYRGVRSCLAAAGLAESLDLPGPLSREEMPSLYAEADVVLITSRGESFCNPAIEAAAAARPLVGPPIPALRETAGPMGHLTNSWRADSLTDAVKAAARVRDAAAKEAARAHAMRFSATASATALRACLASMDQAPQKRAGRP